MTKKQLIDLVDRYADAYAKADRSFDQGRAAFDAATVRSKAARDAVIKAVEENFSQISYDFGD